MNCRKNKKSYEDIFKITLWPMRLLMYLFGALPYELQHKQTCSKLVIIWRLTHLTLIATSVVGLSALRVLKYNEVLYNINDAFSHGMDIISYFSLLILHAIVYWENTWKAYQYEIIFFNFELLRNKFDSEMKHPIDMGRIHLFMMLSYTLLGFYMVIMMLIVIIRYIKSLNASRMLLLQYGDIILKFKLIEFILFVSIVMALQIELNACLLRYKCEIEKNNMMEWHSKQKVFKKIYSLQDIHNILINTVSNIERYCNWSLPGLMLKMFFEFTITAYWIYLTFNYEISALFQSYGFCVTVLNLIILFVSCSICSKCENLDKQFSNQLHMIKHEGFDPFFNACLNEISLQLLHQKLYFTAGGFLDVNYRFFGKYLFSAVCYIVILIQFHMSI